MYRPSLIEIIFMSDIYESLYLFFLKNFDFDQITGINKWLQYHFNPSLKHQRYSPCNHYLGNTVIKDIALRNGYHKYLHIKISFCSFCNKPNWHIQNGLDWREISIEEAENIMTRHFLKLE